MRSGASRDAFPSGAWERHRGGGALLPFVLRVVAGACVGRGSGQPRMPPRERQHEGLGGLGVLIRCAGRALERPFGAVTPLERRDEY